MLRAVVRTSSDGFRLSHVLWSVSLLSLPLASPSLLLLCSLLSFPPSLPLRPLLIDPQLQGIAWLREYQSAPDRSLRIVKLGQKDLVAKLETALTKGHTVVVENMGESIDAALSAVVSRASIKRGKVLLVVTATSNQESVIRNP